MKFIFGALAALSLFVGVAATQPADARCFWNGFGWECFHRPYYGYWHHRYWNWDRPYYRDWRLAPY